jgi:hypothetical protein
VTSENVRRTRRHWPWLLAIGLAGIGALAITLSLPSVQRRIALRIFPTGPGNSLEFQDLQVGLRHVHVRDLRLNWHGLKVAVDEANASYRIIGLLASRTARVDQLRVRGLVVDLRSMEHAGPESAAAAGPPFQFEGLLPFTRLPLRAILSDVHVDVELLTPAPNGDTVRLHAVLSGRDVAPGATGELDADLGLRIEGAKAARAVLAGTGSLRLHESDEGVLDLLQYQGQGHPADPAALKGAGLAVQLSADLTAADEKYRIVLSTTGEVARDVVAVDAVRRASDGRLAGSWTAQLDAGQADPFLGDFVPPEFGLNGTGTFEIAPAARAATTASRFEASASRWDLLRPELAGIGALRFDAELDADFAGPRIAIRSLSARIAIPGAPPVLEIGTDQPFRIDMNAETLEASRWGAPLAHLMLDKVPVNWGAVSGAAVEPFAGTLAGALELTADDPRRIRLRSTAPLALAGLRLHTKARDLGPISSRGDVSASIAPERIEASLAGCRVEFADSSRIAFDGSFTMPRDGRLVAALTGDLALHVAALSRLAPEIDAVHTRGAFGLDIPAGTLALVKAAVEIDDGGGRKLMEGSVSTVRPLVVDLHDFNPRWSEFEPDALRLHLDGFPIAWVSRFLPQIRLASGTLHGDLRATVRPDRSVLIAGDAPFEVRDTNLFWGDLAVLTGAQIEVSPSIVLSRQSIEAELNQIAFKDSRGGHFEGVVRIRTQPNRAADSAFTVDFHGAAPALTSRIGNLGDFEVHAAGSFDGAANRLQLSSASFECKDPEGRSYFSGTSLQPFAVGLANFEVTPGGDSNDLFRAKFVPLEIEKLFPEALGFTLSGPLPSGEAVISARDGGLLFHASRPLEFGPVTVSRNGAPFLDRVLFTVLPEIAYTAKGVRSRETLITISSGQSSIATISTHGVFDILGLTPERTIELTVEAALPALLDQPAGGGLPPFDRGTLALSWRAATGTSRRSDFRLTLSGAARRDGIVAPDVEARAILVEEADGTIRIEAPLRLTAADRTSDLTASGRLRMGENGAHLDLALDSERIVVEDVARLTSAFLPPGAGAETESKPADTGAPRARTLLMRFGPKDGRPPWDRLQGRIPIHFRSIEFDRYAVQGAHATIVSSGDELAIEEIGATFLGASLGGHAAITLDRSGASPVYGVDGALQVADMDLGRMFTTVDPARKPTLEGRFRLDASLNGAGPDPVIALFESRGKLLAEGRDAVFRGLVPGAKSASRLVRVAGALTFSKEVRATGRLIGQLQELHLREAHLELERDPSRGLVLDALDLRTDGLIVHGSGSLRREPGVPLVDRETRLDMNLAAKGDPAIVFDGLGLLGSGFDTEGFRPVTSTFSVGGTFAAPDAGALWETLDTAAEHAKGSFGLALRKAMASVR